MSVFVVLIITAEVHNHNNIPTNRIPKASRARQLLRKTIKKRTFTFSVSGFLPSLRSWFLFCICFPGFFLCFCSPGFCFCLRSRPQVSCLVNVTGLGLFSVVLFCSCFPLLPPVSLTTPKVKRVIENVVFLYENCMSSFY